jgi:ribosomal protein S3
VHVTKLVLIRARLTDAEWKRIRVMAVRQDTTTADLVADTLRAHLLRGAK